LSYYLTHFLRPFLFVFAAALPALGAEGSDSSNAISDDLPFIGYQFTSLYSFMFLFVVFSYSFFFSFSQPHSPLWVPKAVTAATPSRTSFFLS